MSDEPRYEPLDDMNDMPLEDIEPRPSTPVPTPKASKPKNLSYAPPLSSPRPQMENRLESELKVQISVTLPPLIVERMNALRAAAGIAGDAPTKISLIVGLNAPDESGLHGAVVAFEETHLPLSLTLKRVYAAVRDQQTYVAGWQLDQEAQFAKLRADLLESFKPDRQAVAFEPIVPVAEGVPAKQFPALVATMQREFETQTWQIERLKVETEIEKG